MRLYNSAARSSAIMMTLSRGLSELGLREQAITVLRECARRLDDDESWERMLPFLPPMREFDEVPINQSFRKWVKARCLEALISQIWFSGFFMEERDKLWFKRLAENPETSMEIRRRAALNAIRFGRIAEDKDVESLCHATDNNLNAWFWRNVKETTGGCKSNAESTDTEERRLTLVDGSDRLQIEYDMRGKSKEYLNSRILYCAHAPLHYMYPPMLSTNQVFCGSYCDDRIDNSGRLISIKTSNGEYSLPETISRLPTDQKPEIVIVNVDAGFSSVPSELKRVNCKKVLLMGDTHHLKRPIHSVGEYLEKNPFDIHFTDCLKHHLHFFYQAQSDKQFYFFPGFRNRFESKRLLEKRKIQANFVGQTGRFHPYRTKILKMVMSKRFPLNVKSAPQLEAAMSYAESLISLNISLNTELNMRFFEILSVGGFLLTDRISTYTGYEMLFQDGKDFVFFDSGEDLCEKIDHYLRNPEEALQIARHGFETYHKYWSIAKRRKIFFDLVLGGQTHPILASFQDDRFVSDGCEKKEGLRERINVYEFIQDLHRQSALEVFVMPGVSEMHKLDLLDLMRLKMVENDHGLSIKRQKIYPRLLLISDKELLDNGLPSWFRKGAFDYLIVGLNRESVNNGTDSKCYEACRLKGLVKGHPSYPNTFRVQRNC
jgi:hypothetical protein